MLLYFTSFILFPSFLDLTHASPFPSSPRPALVCSSPHTHLDGTPNERAPAAGLQKPGEEVGGRGAEVDELHHAARQVHHALVDVPAAQ